MEHTMGIRTVVLKDELGIITFALEQMGFDIAAFYETDQKAVEMCRRNLKGRCIQKELLECQETDIPDMEFLVAQLPRQILTNPGQRQEMGMNQRRLYKYLEIICWKKPLIFLFETFHSVVKDEGFSNILSEVQRMGYQCMYQLCDIGETTGLPVNEKRIYLIGILAESGMSFHFPMEPVAGREQTQPEDICCSRYTVDPWYLKLPTGRVDFLKDQKVRFYCWRRERYVPREKADWNIRKMPLIYDKNVLRKLTHREMARLKGLPDEFYLDISNKSWLYWKLMYGSNAAFIRRMAETVRRQLSGNGVRNQQMVNTYRFETLLKKYFRYKNINFTDGKACQNTYSNVYKREPDFILTWEDVPVFIEVKWYNGDTGIDGRVI